MFANCNTQVHRIVKKRGTQTSSCAFLLSLHVPRISKQISPPLIVTNWNASSNFHSF
jgi:hypothetical protein